MKRFETSNGGCVLVPENKRDWDEIYFMGMCAPPKSAPSLALRPPRGAKSKTEASKKRKRNTGLQDPVKPNPSSDEGDER